jgi:bifunctional UDP-N-acetylglucosamine pyrophosphorylase / glucosamine-1-phosphate N-acetyltransferase
VHGPSILRDTTVAAGAVIESFSHLEQAVVGPLAHVGPFARLRPGAVLEDETRVGNFVELKKTRMKKGAKANHLSYLGDATIGEKSNIGAGTITCNFDGGPVKHATDIGPGAFVGSNTTLVAPVTLGSGAYVAAGSVITKEIPADALAFGRARQENREGYAKRLRERQGKK